MHTDKGQVRSLGSNSFKWLPFSINILQLQQTANFIKPRLEHCNTLYATVGVVDNKSKQSNTPYARVEVADNKSEQSNS